MLDRFIEQPHDFTAIEATIQGSCRRAWKIAGLARHQIDIHRKFVQYELCHAVPGDVAGACEMIYALGLFSQQFADGPGRFDCSKITSLFDEPIKHWQAPLELFLGQL